MSQRYLGSLFLGLLVGVGVAVSAGTAHAQAWVGEKGSLDLNFDYNYAESNEVLESGNAKPLPNAGTTSNQITIGGEWVPVSHLAIDASLPLLGIEYTGCPVTKCTGYLHPGGGAYDDGDYHWTLTDLRVGAHYQLLEDPLALTPIIAVTYPVANYETVGNAVAGRHLESLHLGLAAGKRIDDFFAQAVYEFSFVQHYDRTAVTDQVGEDTSDASLTLGYLLLQQRLNLTLGGNLHITHGGIDFVDFNSLPHDDQLYHDPLLHENVLLLGGGAAYQVSKAFQVSLAARIFVYGINTQNASVFALGFTWFVM